MVNGKRLKRRLASCAMVLCLVLVWSSMGTAGIIGLAEQPGENPTGQAGSDPADQPRWIIHGPQIPPDGMRYDEWKGIKYSSETEFGVKTGWILKRDNKMNNDTFYRRLQEKGYAMEEEQPVSQYKIVDVRAEAVGGEMKLRTGGYVDIVVTARMSTVFQYSFDTTVQEDDSIYIKYGLVTDDIVSGFRYANAEFRPFDMYTGVTLLNTVINENRGIHPGEAVDSGFVESHVTWNGRTYRLLAREDDRNLGGGGWSHKIENGRCCVRIESLAETVYTFRIPADYDGLALCCPKTVYPSDPNAEDEAQPENPTLEVYADILTENDGTEISMDDVWFIRVSDLLKQGNNSAQD